MKTLMIVAVFSCLSAFAGGLSFEGTYKGTHPLTGKEVIAEFDLGDEYGNYKHIIKMDEGNHIKMDLIVDKFGQLERTLKFVTLASGDQLGTVVTTANCQRVEDFLLVLNSGLQMKMSK